MCGIAATLFHRSPLQPVVEMLKLVRHRGDSSDSPEVIAAGTSALGTERLRILDFTGGRQPFTSFDQQWKIVFNGEIYNYAALRKRLAAKGIQFRTECDTEVLANLIATEGAAAILQLDGMFAFVAIHRDGHRWLAARDPMGIKPLYSVEENGAIYFSSEIYPLLQVTRVAPVEIFPPGTWRTESDSGRYWSFAETSSAPSATLPENAEELKELFEKAVEKRIPRDLPCAILFSGGIDSTLLFHVARRINKQVRGFYIGDETGKDFQYAKLYAATFDVPVVFVPFSRSHVLSHLSDVVRAIETLEPNQIRSGCFSYWISEAIAREGYRVALCGEGADELFCGYPELYEVPHGMTIEHANETMLPRRRHFLDYLHRTQLQRVDRCGMRFSLEVRVPFLDRAILDFAAKLPFQHSVDRDAPPAIGNKRILRELYRLYPELPTEFRDREKVVFVEGSGMGNNSKRSPFYRHAVRLNRPAAPKLAERFSQTLNAEECYYLSLLAKTHDVGRIPHLFDRPQLNAK